MLEVELQRKSLEDWQAGVHKKFRKNLEIAQGEIRRDWQVELFRQQKSRGDGTWAALSPKYAARKARDYANKAKPEVKYNSLLRRTGRMLDGYVNGIEFATTNTTVGVRMPYPPNIGIDERITVRAKTHQGFERGSSRLPIRAFNVEKFEKIAIDHFNEAMKKSTNE